jgi:very-short-patch-repair endonuclease
MTVMPKRIVWNRAGSLAGSNSRTRRRWQQSEITTLHRASLNGVPQFLESSGLSLAPSPKVASSKTAIGSIPSSLEAGFARILRGLKFPTPTREYRFDPVRKWRFDFAWPDQRVAVEIDGGIWTKSGHSTGGGIMRDMEKSNAAQLDGWLVLRFTDKHLEDGSAIEQTKRALGME